jgi:large subunit ribosomal protein L25
MSKDYSASTHLHTPATMSLQAPINAAKALPPRLIRFFQRYPPPALFPNLAATSTLTATSTAPTTTSQDGAETSTLALDLESFLPSPDNIAIPSNAPRNSRIPPHAHDLPYPNPFLPSKNFATGRWHGPAFGLRKQADLVKLASLHGVVDLLPWTIKKPGEKEARRIETGLMVKGTGEGQKVKGKAWERTLKGRLEMRRQAMLNMPAMIMEWKQVCCDVWQGVLWGEANERVEGTWTRLEEVAEWEGEEVRMGLGGLWHCIRICVWHAYKEFGPMLLAGCSILRACVYCTYNTCVELTQSMTE